jgi:hypothetical protein
VAPRPSRPRIGDRRSSVFGAIACAGSAAPILAAVGELVIHMPVIAFCATCDASGTAASGKLVLHPAMRKRSASVDQAGCRQFTSISNLSAIYAPIQSMRWTMRRTSLGPPAMQMVAGEHGAYRNWVY